MDVDIESKTAKEISSGLATKLLVKNGVIVAVRAKASSWIGRPNIELGQNDISGRMRRCQSKQVISNRWAQQLGDSIYILSGDQLYCIK